MRAISLLPVAFLFFGCDVTRTLGDDLSVHPVSPAPGASTGNVHAATAGQPTLRWHASEQAQTFHLQVDDSCSSAASCDFPSPEIDEPALTTTSYTPASPLPPSSEPPLARRYYWRVQACAGNGCGEWSPTRTFVVGQEQTLNRDLNGDGYNDFVLGVPGRGTGGQAWVFLGGPTLPSKPALVVSSDVPSDGLGFAVAMAGDVNGDGFGDYLVRTNGSLGISGGTPPAGRVMLFYGGTTLKSQPDVVFPAEWWGSQESMAGCGDLNGDGYDDVAFAAADLTAHNGLALPFRVEIHFGGPDMASSAPLVLYGEDQADPATDPSGDSFGQSIAAAGDVNGDGYPDLIVGANSGADTSIMGGKVRIYYGGPQMDATPDVILEMEGDGSGVGTAFGSSVVGLGDVNGDGFADVAVGAPGGDGLVGGSGPQPPLNSRAYVYFGGVAPHTSPDVVLQVSQETSTFGVLAPAGDVDHDGYADIAVMAKGTGQYTPTNCCQPRPGKVYLFSGGPDAGQSTIATIVPGVYVWGFAVLDIDGDDSPEIITGRTNDTSARQQVSIYQSADGYAAHARTILDVPEISANPAISR